MATYKVIQDIEAEDKILGPLTLRQFIYAGVTAIMLYLTYLVASKGFAVIAIVFLPVAAVCGFFAFPWRRDQPTEIWALAKIRFLFKPRKRIWDQSGVKELVTITVPKRVEELTSNQLSQNEVKSRLRALADTIDSRGWAIKTAGAMPFNAAQPFLQTPNTSDRLFEISAAPVQPAIVSDVRDSDDMLDEKANPLAQKVDSMISASAQAHRQKLMDTLSAPPAPAQTQPPADYWFLKQPSQLPGASAGSSAGSFGTQVVVPGATSSDLQASQTVDEAAIVHELEEHEVEGPTSSYYGHLKTIKPLSEQRKEAAKIAAAPPKFDAPILPPPPPQPAVTPAKQAAILELARNDDLNVATIARQVSKDDDGEVVIKLH